MTRSLLLAFLLCLLPASVLAGGPGVLVLDSLAARYEPVVFNHEVHVLMAGQCATCHHQHPELGRARCSRCHNISSTSFKQSASWTFLPCRGCHGNYSVLNPSMPSLKVAYHRTCFKCHLGMGGIGTDPKGCTKTCHGRKTAKISLIQGGQQR
jgi:hypothetical protein